MTAAPIVHRVSSADLVEVLTALVLELDPVTVRRLVTAPGERSSSTAVDPELLATLVRLLRSLDSATDQRVPAPLYVEEIVHRVLGRERPSRRPPRHPILAALTFARAHYAEPLTVTDLARRVALSPSAFSAQFREATGRAPYQFLKDLRLDRARELLVDGGTSVTSVSRRVGYTSVSHFIKEFRTRFGMTPKAYADLSPRVPSG